MKGKKKEDHVIEDKKFVNTEWRGKIKDKREWRKIADEVKKHNLQSYDEVVDVGGGLLTISAIWSERFKFRQECSALCVYVLLFIVLVLSSQS